MGRRIEVTPGFCICWAMLLLILPLRLILAAAGAAVVHELCHVLAVRAMGGDILGLTVGAGGAVMEMTPMPPVREMLCALAGPAGSILLALLSGICPLLGVCAFAQGCFNLLPLHPLDGGRALACGLRILGLEQYIPVVEVGTLLLLLAAAFRLRMGPGPFLVWGMVAIRKIPCKDMKFGVQ